ncbi:3-hydroxyisobutyrate dehydrogenase [Raineyella antarctica]|uniref:3-hydroxyisobutyrate dehydrogenase n=1 Tax=Raineyella antarctica TaxID=1577474 RepID=A0A1G6HQ64_9ACTN|nr:NAD(P)-dependent oxidoreductase [Raineyella antarctica]SDB96334.1 3-hydroxyisobutyrate dehydrogenase [Raineyella antarctica]
MTTTRHHLTHDAAVTTRTVGLVGLGNMGAAVASRLATYGTLLAYDRDEARRTAVAAKVGATACAGLPEVAAAPVVVLSLPSPKISLAVAAELAETMAPGSLVIETSTVNPSDMEQLARILNARGIRVIDAAILSGVAGMEKGTTTLLTSGDEADLADALPVLEAMTPSIKTYGRLGAGMAAKVINNAVAHAVMVVLSEVAALGASAGISLEELVDLLGDPEAGLIRPLTHRVAERVAQGDYQGGMPTDAARKDSTLALEFAQQAGVPLFAIQGAHTVYELALAGGLARQDYASIASLWEQWTGRELA